MRSMVVVGLLLLAVLLASTGCVAPGEGEKGEFDTRYSIEQQRYVPVEGPQGEQVEEAAEGAETE